MGRNNNEIIIKLQSQKLVLILIERGKGAFSNLNFTFKVYFKHIILGLGKLFKIFS